MLFTKQDGILIKVLRQSKGYSARKLLGEFHDKEFPHARKAVLFSTGPTSAAD